MTLENNTSIAADDRIARRLTHEWNTVVNTVQLTLNQSSLFLINYIVHPTLLLIFCQIKSRVALPGVLFVLLQELSLLQFDCWYCLCLYIDLRTVACPPAKASDNLLPTFWLSGVTSTFSGTSTWDYYSLERLVWLIAWVKQQSFPHCHLVVQSSSLGIYRLQPYCSSTWIFGILIWLNLLGTCSAFQFGSFAFSHDWISWQLVDSLFGSFGIPVPQQSTEQHQPTDFILHSFWTLDTGKLDWVSLVLCHSESTIGQRTLPW